MVELIIEKKHLDLIKYATGKINAMPKSQRILADMMRRHLYEAWDYIGLQQWRKNRMAKMCIAGKINPVALVQVWASFCGYAKHCSCRATLQSVQAEINTILKGE